MLFILDVYSRGNAEAPFFLIPDVGPLRSSRVSLARDVAGHIVALTGDSITIAFNLDGAGNVTAYYIAMF